MLKLRKKTLSGAKSVTIFVLNYILSRCKQFKDVHLIKQRRQIFAFFKCQIYIPTETLIENKLRGANLIFSLAASGAYRLK